MTGEFKLDNLMDSAGIYKDAYAAGYEDGKRDGIKMIVDIVKEKLNAILSGKMS